MQRGRKRSRADATGVRTHGEEILASCGLHLKGPRRGQKDEGARERASLKGEGEHEGNGVANSWRTRRRRGGRGGT